MLEVAKKILLTNRWFCSQDNPSIEEIYPGAWEFSFENGPIFIVCNEEGKENILKAYREASKQGALIDIPSIYHPFFRFTDFVKYVWTSLYDIYDDVDEVLDDNQNVWHICSL